MNKFYLFLLSCILVCGVEMYGGLFHSRPAVQAPSDDGSAVVVDVGPDGDTPGEELLFDVAEANAAGDFFERFVAEVQENLADETRSRIGRLEDLSVPEANHYLSVGYYNHCAAEAAAIRADAGADSDSRLYRKSKELIKNIMEWLPERDISYGRTEKRLADFTSTPAFFEIAMSRDGVVVYIPNPYFLNETGKTCIQLLHEERHRWNKKLMMRPGASEDDLVDDAHAIWLFQYLE